MAQQRHVTVLGLDGSKLLAERLPGTTTVSDLRDLLFKGVGTPVLAQRLLHGSRILRSRATLEEAGVEDGACLTLVVTFEAVEYRVLQGRVFKRPGEDPAEARQIVASDRRVGSKVRTTGRTWVGPQGGKWVELDPSVGKPSWALVEGPGFPLLGPLLERVCPGEEEPLVLSVRSPADDEELRQLCLRPSLLMQEVAQCIALRFHWLHLVPGNIVFVRAKKVGRSARFTPSRWVIPNSVPLCETPFGDGEELLYLYLGDLDDWQPSEIQCPREASGPPDPHGPSSTL